jgi:hypothetical protein
MNTMIRLSLAIFLLGTSVLGTSVAKADFIEIGGPDCGTCFGGIYTLEGLLIDDSTAGEETWRFTYTVDLSGYTGTTDFVGALAYKVTNGYISDAVVSAPTDGVWSQISGKNINQCDGTGMGWLCTEWVLGTQLLVSQPTTYSWISNITMVAGTLIDTWSIQADFDPATGQLLSEKAVRVPEPGTLALFGLGLIAMGFARRGKRT